MFDVNSGQQLYQLSGHDTVLGDEYGVSVDISGTRAIVGALSTNTGKAYVYDLTNGTQITSLISDDASPNDLFGVAVAIDGTTALVGARYDDDFDTASGSAYCLMLSRASNCTKLNAHDAAWGDRFGMYLDLDGNTALVASRYDDDERKSSGSAYLFDVDTGLERYKLVADDMNANDHFGSSISLSGNFALIGAANDYDFVPFGGSAYIFDVHSGQQVLKLFPQDPGVLDQFGTAVSLDGNRALVGAMQSAFDGSVNATGKAYVYDLNLVPEPSAAFPMLLGLTFLAWIGRRK
ncbi:MAG: PEP-CTERM sorting domain-containing protein [Pirellulaceae bacterium]